MFEFTIPTGSVPQSPRTIAASVVAHGLAILLLFALQFSGGVLRVSNIGATPRLILIAPPPDAPIPRPKIRALPPLPRQFHPLPPSSARFELPAAPVIQAPALEIPKLAVPEIPKTPVMGPVIIASGFNEARLASPPTPVAAPKLVIKTSGFQSEETAATSPLRAKSSTVGSFDTAPAAEGATRKGNGVTRPGGFSDGAASATNLAHHGPIASAAFGDSTVGKNAVTPRKTEALRFTPVEILSKPKPAYTDEARTQKIEGEVLLDMEFSASGETRVLRLVHGLGHGLDETAVTAALGIRFRPAIRDGATVDSSAVVHIVFQLAN